ncbi:hypothetical protein [Methylobacterium komagatae]
MTLLQSPTPSGMLRVSRLLLRSMLSRAGGDSPLLADGLRVVVDLEARVASGELDAEAAAADAGRLTRTLMRTGSHRDPACH